MKPLSGVTIGVVGCGKMGQALIKGLRSGGLSGKKIIITDVDRALQQKVSRSLKVASAAGIAAVAKKAQVIILAVKPQQMAEVGPQVARTRQPSACIISIAAGITIRRLSKLIPKASIVRVMPNLPATVGMGFSAIAFGLRVSRRQRLVAKAIFESVGEVVVLPEPFFDAITAVSGSGPAYLFFLVLAWEAAARKLKLPRDIAASAVRQTLKGSLQLLQVSGASPEALMAQVASKKGTTEAALKVLAKRGVARSFAEALSAAQRRSRQLSRG